MLETYFTVNLHGSETQIIQKSRFIGHIKRVETEAAALEFIHEIKAIHNDATHNCSAYIIGEQDHIQKANDDGEPTGTAGVPMLEVLKRQGLKDTAVVVTRYFGGIKLGAGGLIRAYGSTTSLAIKATGIVKRKLTQGYSITIDYPLLGKVENALRQSSHLLRTINYLEKVEFIVYVEIDMEQNFLDWITDMTSDQAVVIKKDVEYTEIALSSREES